MCVVSVCCRLLFGVLGGMSGGGCNLASQCTVQARPHVSVEPPTENGATSHTTRTFTHTPHDAHTHVAMQTCNRATVLLRSRIGATAVSSSAAAASLSAARAFHSHSTRFGSKRASTPRILVTGSVGQIGTELVSALRTKYGVEHVVASDIKAPTPDFPEGPFVWADVMNYDVMARVILENRIDTVVHLASLLSAVGVRDTHTHMADTCMTWHTCAAATHSSRPHHTWLTCAGLFFSFCLFLPLVCLFRSRILSLL